MLAFIVEIVIMRYDIPTPRFWGKKPGKGQSNCMLLEAVNYSLNQNSSLDIAKLAKLFTSGPLI